MKPICFECGYSLGDLDAQERCPECGADAEFARRTLVQRFSRPELAGSAATSAAVALGTLLAAMLVVPVTFVTLGLADGSSTGLAPVSIWCVLWFVTWWSLAQRDPTHPTDDRRAAVIRSLLQVINGAALIAVIAFTVAIASPDEFREFGAAIGVTILVVVSLVHLLLASMLASRIIRLCYRRPRVIWRARLLQCSVTASAICIIPLCGWFLYGAPQQASGFAGVLVQLQGGLATLAALFVLLTYVLAVGVLDQLRGALHHASRRYKVHIKSELAARRTS